ncbi:MAG: putative lipid II flippase FtsW [Candidatus Glassbacteria bacterium]|nr:putative lipid II flippase FtsW [Candidatus Glassbacteria bacterium]
MAGKNVQADTSRQGGRLMVISVVMALAGIIVILSATNISARSESLSSFAYLEKQALRAAIGIVVMLVASRIDYHRMRAVSFLALLVTAALLLICLLPGTYKLAPVIGGARRWIHLGPLNFQPSELAKFFLVCWAAGYLVRKRENIRSFRGGFMPFLIFIGIFFLLVVKQPDLSMAAVLLIMVFTVGFIGGIKPAHILLIGLMVTPLVTYKYVMKVGYRSERLSSFLESGVDKSGIGYQAYQSRIALGSGGISGLGLGQSRQKFFYLPAAHTDFIFSIIGEEIGFLGTMAVLAAFLALCITGVKVARGSPDYYGFLLASGLTMMIFCSALLHMAVVSGLTPTTGLPLPFFSYGGTNLVTTLWSIGIIINISRAGARGAHSGKV